MRFNTKPQSWIVGPMVDAHDIGDLSYWEGVPLESAYMSLLSEQCTIMFDAGSTYGWEATDYEQAHACYCRRCMKDDPGGCLYQ